MTTRTVTTQADLDTALKEQVDVIYIDSPRGVWLTISNSGSATVRASGSATVEAYGSATVRAYGSATVRAYDSATVRAYDSATVEAYDSATVRAYDSATVRAYDSATVEASGSATVEASGSATVRAYDSATVEAGKYVAVHLHSKRVRLDGGVVIDVTDIDLTDKQTWLDYHGIKVEDGNAVLVKAVDADLVAGHSWTPTTYLLGEKVTCPDWQPTTDCGHGLHFSYNEARAASYVDTFHAKQPIRYLEVHVAVDELIIVGDDKVKAPSCVALREVDAVGRPVTAVVSA